MARVTAPASDSGQGGRTAAHSGAAALVGRGRELEALAAAVARPPALVLLEGEAGIGKSRLISEYFATPEGQEHRVLSARCPPLAQPFPFSPIAEALREFLDVDAVERLGALAAALCPLFPEHSSILPDSPETLEDSREIRHRLFQALARLLVESGTTVVVFEDAHWADEATLEFFLYAWSQGEQPASLVITSRPGEVPPDSLLHRIGAGSLPVRCHERIALSALSRDETATFIASMAGTRDVPEKLVSFVHHCTAGIPFVLEEFVRALRDRMQPDGADGDWMHASHEQMLMPGSVRDFVLERFARLDFPARQVVAAASMMNAPVPLNLLARVAGLSPEHTHRGANLAVEAGLVVAAGPQQYTVRHALVSRAVYRAIPHADRRRLHRRAGEELEELPTAPPSRLALHFRAAGDFRRWARYAERAADAAASSGDDRTAVATLLDVLAGADVAVADGLRLGRKLAMTAVSGRSVLDGLADRVVEQLHCLAANDDLTREARGELRLLLGRFLGHVGRLDDGLIEVERSITDLENRPTLAARAMMILAWPWFGGKPSVEHREWLARAAERMAQVDDRTERHSLSVNLGVAHLMLGDAAGWGMVSEIPDIADQEGRRSEDICAHLNIAHAAMVWGHYRRATDFLDRARKLIDATGYTRVRNTGQVICAHLDYLAGYWSGLSAQAERLANAAESQPLPRLEARLIQGLLAYSSGRLEHSEKWLRSVITGFPGAGLDDVSISAAAGLGRLELGRDRPGRALSWTDPSVDKIRATGIWLCATDILPVRVEALIRSGRLDRVDALLEEFAAGLTDCPAPAAHAALSECRALAVLAHGDPAQAHAQFQRVAARWTRLSRPLDSLRARERAGFALLESGHEKEALESLGKTARLLRELGAEFDAERIERRLRMRGTPLRGRGGRPGYGNRLSPREEEVVSLIVETGGTNRQIAEILCLSPRTVACHVNSAMRKLGVSSRTALAIAVVNANDQKSVKQSYGQSR